MNKKNLKNLFSIGTTEGKIFLSLLFIISTALLILPLFLDIDYKAFTTLGLVGLFVINFLGSATFFLPAPAIVSVAIAAGSFNPIIVALVAAVASALGEAIAFIFGYSSAEVLNLKKHKYIYKVSRALVHWKGGILIPLFSFVPNPLFDGLGILAGISNFPLLKFVIYTFLGRLVRNIGIAYLGLFLWF